MSSFTNPDTQKQELNKIIKIQEHKRQFLENLFKNGEIPEIGLDETTLQFIMNHIAGLDCNNHKKNVSMGEREARIYSESVLARNFRLGHGIGKSGDLGEQQPKAAGSSLLYQVTNRLVLHATKLAGIKSVTECGVIPMPVEMSLSLSMRAFSVSRPNATFVLWPRDDKRFLIESILASGYKPIVIPNKQLNDSVYTEIDHLHLLIRRISPLNIVCVLSSAWSYFPKSSDDILRIGSVCKEYNIPHLVNYSQGFQSTSCNQLIEKALEEKKIDLIVQSTAESFMVGDGGSFIYSSSPNVVGKVMQTYSGRASISPIIDTFLTLLQMGINKYKKILFKRKKTFSLIIEKITEIESFGCLKLLSNPLSDSSISISSTTVNRNNHLLSVLKKHSHLKFKLIEPGKHKSIKDYSFKNWGTLSDEYLNSYINISISLSISSKDVTSQFEIIKNELLNEHPSLCLI